MLKSVLSELCDSPSGVVVVDGYGAVLHVASTETAGLRHFVDLLELSKELLVSRRHAKELAVAGSAIDVEAEVVADDECPSVFDAFDELGRYQKSRSRFLVPDYVGIRRRVEKSRRCCRSSNKTF